MGRGKSFAKLRWVERNWVMKYMDPPLPGPNPCLVERMPEVRQPRYIPSEEDFWKVYDMAERQDKVLLLTFLHLAARRGEIFQLQWDDVDFISRRIRLKTRKRRDGTLEYDWLPMTEELRKALRWWWENRPIKNHDYVFICVEESISSQEHYGQPFKQRRHLMNRLCDKAEIRRFGFHAIRHLTATILYHAGYDLGVIQAILRHKYATTTNQYLRSLGLENLRAAMEEGLPIPKAQVIKLPITKQKKLKNAE